MNFNYPHEPNFSQPPPRLPMATRGQASYGSGAGNSAPQQQTALFQAVSHHQQFIPPFIAMGSIPPQQYTQPRELVELMDDDEEDENEENGDNGEQQDMDLEEADRSGGRAAYARTHYGQSEGVDRGKEKSSYSVGQRGEENELSSSGRESSSIIDGGRGNGGGGGGDGRRGGGGEDHPRRWSHRSRSRSPRSKRYRSRSRSRERYRRHRRSSRSRSREGGHHRSRSRSPRRRSRDRGRREIDSTRVMITTLPQYADKEMLHHIIAKQGFHPVDIRVVRRSTDGGMGLRMFGFVEFTDSSSAHEWMSHNRGQLSFEDGFVSWLEFSRDPPPNLEDHTSLGAFSSSGDWTCARCTINNFNRRASCFKCGITREESEALDAKGVSLVGVAPSDTLLIRELPASVNEAGVRRALRDYGNCDTAQRVHLPRPRYYALVQLRSVEEAMAAMQAFNKSVPYIDNCAVIVTYSRQSLNQILLKNNAGLLKGQHRGSSYGSSRGSSDQPHSNAAAAQQLGQNAIQIAQMAASSGSDSHHQPAPQSISTPFGYFPSFSTPDPAKFQFEPSSGYYYDAATGFYYDPRSEFYFQPNTGAWHFWCSRYSTYIPCEGGDQERKQRLRDDERAERSQPQSAVIQAGPALANQSSSGGDGRLHSEVVQPEGTGGSGLWIGSELATCLEDQRRLVAALRQKLPANHPEVLHREDRLRALEESVAESTKRKRRKQLAFPSQPARHHQHQPSIVTGIGSSSWLPNSPPPPHSEQPPDEVVFLGLHRPSSSPRPPSPHQSQWRRLPPQHPIADDDESQSSGSSWRTSGGGGAPPVASLPPPPMWPHHQNPMGLTQIQPSPPPPLHQLFPPQLEQGPMMQQKQPFDPALAMQTFLAFQGVHNQQRLQHFLHHQGGGPVMGGPPSANTTSYHPGGGLGQQLLGAGEGSAGPLSIESMLEANLGEHQPLLKKKTNSSPSKSLKKKGSSSPSSSGTGHRADGKPSRFEPIGASSGNRSSSKRSSGNAEESGEKNKSRQGDKEPLHKRSAGTTSSHYYHSSTATATSELDEKLRSDLKRREEADLLELNVCGNCARRGHLRDKCTSARASDLHVQSTLRAARRDRDKEALYKEELRKAADDYHCDRHHLVIQRIREMAPHGLITRTHVVRPPCEKCSRLGHTKRECTAVEQVDRQLLKLVTDELKAFARLFWVYLQDDCTIDFSRKFATFDVMDSIEASLDGVDPVSVQLRASCPTGWVTARELVLCSRCAQLGHTRAECKSTTPVGKSKSSADSSASTSRGDKVGEKEKDSLYEKMLTLVTAYRQLVAEGKREGKPGYLLPNFSKKEPRKSREASSHHHHHHRHGGDDVELVEVMSPPSPSSPLPQQQAEQEQVESQLVMKPPAGSSRRRERLEQRHRLRQAAMQRCREEAEEKKRVDVSDEDDDCVILLSDHDDSNNEASGRKGRKEDEEEDGGEKSNNNPPTSTTQDEEDKLPSEGGEGQSGPISPTTSSKNPTASGGKGGEESGEGVHVANASVESSQLLKPARAAESAAASGQTTTVVDQISSLEEHTGGSDGEKNRNGECDDVGGRNDEDEDDDDVVEVLTIDEDEPIEEWAKGMHSEVVGTAIASMVDHQEGKSSSHQMEEQEQSPKEGVQEEEEEMEQMERGEPSEEPVEEEEEDQIPKGVGEEEMDEEKEESGGVEESEKEEGEKGEGQPLVEAIADTSSPPNREQSSEEGVGKEEEVEPMEGEPPGKLAREEELEKEKECEKGGEPSLVEAALAESSSPPKSQEQKEQQQEEDRLPTDECGGSDEVEKKSGCGDGDDNATPTTSIIPAADEEDI